MFRKEYLFTPVMKVIEVTLLALVTTSFAFWLPYCAQSMCFVIGSGLGSRTTGTEVQYNCPTGYYNPLATLLLNTEGSIMRNIMTGSMYGGVNYDELTVVRMGIFGCFWFFFSMLTYGASIPSGVFLSAMFVGCAVG